MFHPIDIELPKPRQTVYTATDGPVSEGTVLIPRDFHLTGISAHYRVNGEYLSGGGGTFTVGDSTRRALLDGVWKLLDTKLNREWTSTWAPLELLLAADNGPFQFGAAESLVSGNTLMRMTFKTTYMAAPIDTVLGITAVNAQSLHVVLHGYEEKEEA